MDPVQTTGRLHIVSGLATFDPTGGPDGEALITFDEEHPASKISLTGGLLEIEDGISVTAFSFDRGEWQNCLATP